MSRPHLISAISLIRVGIAQKRADKISDSRGVVASISDRRAHNRRSETAATVGLDLTRTQAGWQGGRLPSSAAGRPWQKNWIPPAMRDGNDDCTGMTIGRKYRETIDGKDRGALHLSDLALQDGARATRRSGITFPRTHSRCSGHHSEIA